MQHLSAVLFSIALLAKASLFMVCCMVLGGAARRLISRVTGAVVSEEPFAYLRPFFDITVGMGVLTAVLFLLGIGSVLSIAVTSAVLIVMMLASVLYLARSARNTVANVRSSRFVDWTILAQGVFFAGLFVLVVCIAVGPPGHWDDTSYHLPYARHYIDNHAIVMNPYLRFPLFPHNGNLLFSLGLMYGTAADAQVIATLPLFVISLGLFGACQLFIRSSFAGYIAVLCFFALGPVKEALGYAYIDNILALYCWGAMLAMALWLRNNGESGHLLVVSAVLAGSAAGTKPFGGVMAFLIGLYLLVLVRRSRQTAIYALTTLLFGVGWYVHSFYISGDPVHPLGGNIFGHYLWNAADLASAAQEQSTHGAEKSLLNIFSILRTAGVLLLIPALLVLLHPAGWRKPVFFLSVLFIIYFLFWLFSSQVARYLAPILPAGAFLSVLFIYQAGLGASLNRLGNLVAKPWLARVGDAIVAVCGLTMIWAGSQLVPAQLTNWDARLKARAGYEVMTAANDLMPQYGKVMLQVGYENAFYFFKGTAIGDWFGPGRYTTMLRCAAQCQVAPAAQMVAVMNEFGAQILAVNAKRFEFDPSQYMDLFEIKKKTEDGYLLTLKKQR
jgi:hypothetical protein